MKTYDIDMHHWCQVIGTVKANSPEEALKKAKEDLCFASSTGEAESEWGDVSIALSDGGWDDNRSHVMERDDS